MPTITDYLKYANLQMATEAFLVDANDIPFSDIADIERALKAGNGHATKFTASEATKFAAEWQVVDQCPNKLTGFSGTLFRNRDTREYVISFRSTEFIDDAIRDSAATNTLEVFKTGWAFGQLSDMESWYQSVKSQIDGPLNVTGYSLGGHLATAFNLLHPGAADQVVTFNGAGVGKINAGQTLQGVLAYFDDLRANPTNLKAALAFTTPELASFYERLQDNLKGGIWTAAQAKGELSAFSVGAAQWDEAIRAGLEAEKTPLYKALNAILSLQAETDRIKNFTSGGTPDTVLNAVPADQILAQTLDYRLAVDLASQRTSSVLSVLSKTPGTPPLTNQYDLVGKETTQRPWSAVANSGVHYGTNVDLFIEDQPLTRGNFVANVIKGLTGFEINLLQDKYELNNFADSHSLVLIVDSLNVQNVLLNLIPEAQRTTATDTLNTILKNASWRKAEINGGQGQAEGDVLENVVNALADLILGPQAKADRLSGSAEGNTWANLGETNPDASDYGNFTGADGKTYSGREALYAKLKAIADNDAYKQTLAGKLTLTPSTRDLAGAARNDFGAFAALYSLSPFVLSTSGNELQTAVGGAWGETYTTWQQDKDTLADASKPQAVGISEQWLADRAEFLMRKNAFALKNTDPYNPDLMEGSGAAASPTLAEIYFEDAETDYKIQQGRLDGSAARRYFFGKRDADDTFTAGNYADHLYGGGGNDVLYGYDQNDYLEGNAGNDELYGGAGADTLVGGKGDDILEGGAGDDLYLINSGDGNDRIKDSGSNRILYDGKLLTGAFVQDTPGGAYRFVGDGGQTLEFGSTGMLALDAETSITFDNQPSSAGFADGDFGLRLIDAPVADGLSLTGDLAPTSSPVRYDALDNVIVDPARPMPNRADALNGAAGDDRIEGLGGADIVNGFAGNDLLAGGVGADILVGGLGNDRLYANVQAAVDANASQTNEGAEILAGGGGDDLLVGSGGNDALFGGEGKDVLIGGSGADNLLGDVDADRISRTWSVTRSLIPQGNGIDYHLAYANLVTTEGPGADDVLYGGAGDDWLFGGAGRDILDGGVDADILFGEAGDDTLLGGTGNDVLNGDGGTQQGDDWLGGGEGDDTLLGMGGQDSLHGDAGNDSLAGGDGNDSLDGGTGDDILHGEAGNDTLQGGAGSDHLEGGEGNDSLDGGTEADELNGGTGDDTYLITAGQAPLATETENITDGSGTDTVRLQGFDPATLKASAVNGRDLLLTDGANRIVVVNGMAGSIERFELDGETLGYAQLIGRYADGAAQGAGADGQAWQFGGRGKDALTGLGGKLLVAGGAGDDGLNLQGNDNIILYGRGDGTDRVLTGGAGNVLRLGPGIAAADLTLGLGSLAIQVGQDARDTIHFDTFDANAVLARKPFDRVEFEDGGSLTYEQLLARGFDLAGSAGNDLIAGTNVADRIIGGAGNDTLMGGAGDDRYRFALGDGQDKIIDTAGNDTVAFGPGLNAADMTVAQRSDAGGRWLDLGFAGGDKVSIKDGDRGVIERFEFADGTVLSTETLLDQLPVRDLLGAAGNDTLLGGAGDDSLDGAGGDDLLGGQGGNDRYRIGSAPGNDVIEDTGANTLVLDGGIGFDALSATRQGDGLVLAQRGVSGSTRLAGYFADGTPWTVVAADGQTTDTDSLLAATTARAANVVATLRANFEGDLRNGFAQTMASSGFAARADGSYVRHTTAGAYANYNITTQTISSQSGSESSSSTRWTKGAFAQTAIPQSFGPAVIADESARLVRNAVTSNAANIVATNSPVTSNPFNAYYSYDTIIEGIARTNGFWRSPGLGYWNQANTSFSFTTAEMNWNVVASNSSTSTYTYFQNLNSTSPLYVTDTVRNTAQTLNGSVLGVAPGVVPTEGSQAFPRYVRAMAFTQSLQRDYAVVTAGDGANVIDGGDLVDAGGGNDTVLVRGAAFVDGGAGDDRITSLTNQGGILFGNAGNDTVTGGGGIDTLIGGAGTDTLNGGHGNDTYRILDSEDSIDWIEDSGGQDTVVFGTGVRADTLTVTGGTKLGYLALTQGNGTGVRLHIGALGRPDVETVAFEDGSTVATAQLLVAQDRQWVSGTDAAEVLRLGVGNDNVYAGGGNDLADGGAGNDYLAGQAGDDTLYGSWGNDTLDSGTGNDTLDGGAGNDTYLFGTGDGQDGITSREDSPTKRDLVQFKSGIAPSDIVARQQGGTKNLILTIAGTQDQLTVQDYFANDGAFNPYGIEAIRFADGTTWDYAAVRVEALAATEGDDRLYAFDTDDTIRGSGGDDVIVGRFGNDILDGGPGNDGLAGGNGNDTYLFGRGDGQDQIFNNDMNPSKRDVIQFKSGIVESDIEVSRDDYALILKVVGTQDQLIVWNDFVNDLFRFTDAFGNVTDAPGALDIAEIRFANGARWDKQAIRSRLAGATEGDDVLYGFYANDAIDGLGGNDRLIGLGGNDRLLGGDGYDTLHGASGDDTLSAGPGGGELIGGLGDDIYLFDRGDGDVAIDQGAYEYDFDGFHAGTGDTDIIRFGAGITPDDIVTTVSDGALTFGLTGGSDAIHVRGWRDGTSHQMESFEFANGTVWSGDLLPIFPVLGTNGADTLAGTAGKDILSGEAGDDTVFGMAGNDSVAGGVGNDTLSGGAGNDTLFGGAGDDRLFGEAGNDGLNAGPGGGVLAGGAGNDVYVFNRGDGGVTIDQRIALADDPLSDLYAGSSDRDVIRFGAGITAGDLVVSFSPDDNNTLTLTIAGTGDAIHLRGWRDAGSRQIERFEFADGGAWSADTVPIPAVTGTDRDDTLVGTSGPDTLLGEAGSDMLSGGAGNDTLLGGTGDDHLFGEAGDDSLNAGPGGGVLAGGLGNDTYVFNRGDGGVTIDQRIAAADDPLNELYAGSSDRDVIRFGAGITAGDLVVSFSAGDNNTLTLNVAGSSDAIYLRGWRDAGSRRIERIEFADGGAWSADTVPVPAIVGTAGDDTVVGTAGTDTLLGEAGNDTLSGGAGNDMLFGGAGDDRLFGEAGDDSLNAGPGGGVLAGGLGNDAYVFNRGDGGVAIDQRVAVADDPWSDLYAGNSDHDVIRFGAGITASDLVVSFSADDNNTLTLNVAGSSDAIHLRGWRDAGSRQIERFEFADGGAWSADTVPVPAIAGTAGDDALMGSSGNDVLVAGAGDNTLVGGEGDDTFVADTSAGVDRISDTGGIDTLVLGGATLGEISLGVGSLMILVKATGREIHIDDFDPEHPLDAGGIEYFRFADGSVLDKQELIAALGFHPTGGEGNDSLSGTALDDRLSGNGGDDALRGGRGNDLLEGGDGADVFQFNVGDGFDTIVDMADSNGNRIAFGAGITRDSIGLATDGADLLIGYGARDSILVTGYGAPGQTGDTVIGRIDFADGTSASIRELMNQAPVAVPLRDVTIAEDSGVNVFAAAGFFDADGDPLAYSASQADGAALPAWLSFDAASGVLSGFAQSADLGEVALAVTATDPFGGAAAQTFRIAVASVNHAPIPTAVLGDQSVLEDAAFIYQLPADAFVDRDAGDAFTLSARLANGAALPAWLSFDAATGTFSGVPANVDVGAVAIQITATDLAGASASQNLMLTIVDTNDAPTSAIAIGDAVALQDALFQLDLPLGAFRDVDAHDVLSYSAALADGSPLPGWLHLDAATGSLRGTPANGDVGAMGVVIEATDSSGASASQQFGLLVANANDAPVAVGALPDQAATAGGAFAWSLPADLFSDVDVGDSLTLSLAPSDGEALPDWLVFDPASGIISGIPASGDVGVLSLSLFAADSAGENARIDFRLAVASRDLTLTGTDGKDSLIGGGGDDTLSGGLGADWLAGGAGNDAFQLSADGAWTPGFACRNDGSPGHVGSGNAVSIRGLVKSFDAMDGGPGIDLLLGTAGNDVIVLDDAYSPSPNGLLPRFSSIEHIDAGDGNDVVDLTSRRWGYGDVVVDGGNGGDVLWTAEGNDSLSGGAGNDTLDGGWGSDTMVGGLGNDVYVVDQSSDVIVENAGEGTDTVQSYFDYALGATLENLALLGSAAVNGTGSEFNNVLTGNALANILAGGSGNDTLNGGVGADTLIGGAGDDVYVADNAGDVVVEAAGEGVDRVQASLSYTLAAEVENLALTGTASISGTGNALDNVITGTTGNNTLTGNAGNDTLDGRAGTDVLVGGTGDDTYLFGAGYGRDAIRDNDSTTGNSDAAQFLAGIAADQIWLRHLGNNLEASIIGTTDKLTLENWYLGSSYRVEQFKTADNSLLLDSRVEVLVQAMAAFAPPAAGQTTLPPTYQDALAPVIAANWQ